MSRKSKSNVKGLLRPQNIVCLFLVIATLAVYWQVKNFDFVGYDDQIYIIDNRHVQTGLTVKGFQWAFTTFYAGNWHPLTWISHMLDCEIYGLNPKGHHLSNLLLHLANTLLLFFIFMKMTGALWRSAFVAALFALHPLHVESVAWVAERKDVLSTFWGMLSFLAYQHYVKRPSIFNYMLIIIFLSLGLMAKPMLVTLPFVFLLLDFWPLKRCQWRAGRLREDDEKSNLAGRDILRLILEKVPLLVPVVISSILTFMAESGMGAVKSLEAFSLKVRVANAFVSYVSYIVKAVWPRNLSVFYPHPGSTLHAWQPIGAAFLIAGAFYLAIRKLRQYPYIAVGLFWYFGTLLPVIGFVQIGKQAMADRYTYIPLIGFFIIVAWGASDIFKKWRFRRNLLFLASGITLSVLMICTWFQIRHWQNSQALFENALRVTQNNSVAHYGLGLALSEQGKLDEAILHYSKALQIDPRYDRVYNHFAIAMARKGNIKEAIVLLRQGLNIDPNHARAQNNLANLLSSQGKLDEAVLHYIKALRINPEYADAHYNLGSLLTKKEQFDEALTHFAETIKINPEYARAYNDIGLILIQKGEVQQAGLFFSKALQIDPEFDDARRNLYIVKQSLPIR